MRVTERLPPPPGSMSAMIDRERPAEAGPSRVVWYQEDAPQPRDLPPSMERPPWAFPPSRGQVTSPTHFRADVVVNDLLPPMELCQWAVRMAAERMQGQVGHRLGRGGASLPAARCLPGLV